VESDIEKMSPERQRRARAVSSSDERLTGLIDTVNAADDGVFTAFCARIGVATIRDYEDVQLKMAREESEAMEAFSAQQARVTHQYVPFSDIAEK